MSEGVVYGNYLLLGRLAQGDMSEVFLAKRLDNNDPNQLLAIKRVLPRYCDDRDFVAMLRDEVRIAKSLSHPNICRVFDEGECAGQPFVVMEFIHGKDLKATQRYAAGRGEPVPLRFVAHIVAKIAEALDYAHRKTNAQGALESVIHRDVSPQNVLVSYDGVPKLIDFGIVKARDRIVRTRDGALESRFAYMSPEQATGQPLDGRADIFSLGVVLYELLTGELPFGDANDASTLQKIARANCTPAQELNSAIPRRLAAAVERAMVRDREQRYSCGTEMAADLERHLADENREVSAGALSAYIRKLFRDDYIREMSRIKAFLAVDSRAVEPQSEAAGAAAPEPRAIDPDLLAGDETHVESSQFLAAGHDASPGHAAEVVVDAHAASSGTIVLSAADVRVETLPRLTDRPAPFVEAPPEEAGQEKVVFLSPTDEPAPRDQSFWEGDDAPTTDEISNPLDAALSPPVEPTGTGEVTGNLADELEPITDPEPVLDSIPDEEEVDPALITDRVHGASEHDVEDPFGETTDRHDAEDPFGEKTEKFSADTLMLDPALAAMVEQHQSGEKQDGGEARRMPDPKSEVELSDPGKTQAVSLEQAEDFDIVEASRVVSLGEPKPSSPSVAQASTRELGNKELEAIVEEASGVAARAPDSLPMVEVSEDEFDDILTRNKLSESLPAAAPAMRSQETPSGKHNVEPRPAEPVPEQPTPTNIPTTAHTRRRGRLMTDVEIALLILAAAIGTLSVVGTYWYVSTVSIERLKVVIEPGPAPTASSTLPEAGPAKPR